MEAAIVTPLFFLLIFALIEFSNYLRTKDSVLSADRSALLVGKRAPDGITNQDWQILSKVREELSAERLQDVNCVVVFRANSTNRNDTANKNTNCTSCPTGKCNVYNTTKLETLGTSDVGFTGDSHWPYQCRIRVRNYVRGPGQEPRADYLGIYIDTNYRTITGLFPVLPNKIKQLQLAQIDSVQDSGEAPTGVGC